MSVMPYSEHDFGEIIRYAVPNIYSEAARNEVDLLASCAARISESNAAAYYARYGETMEACTTDGIIAAIPSFPRPRYVLRMASLMRYNCMDDEPEAGLQEAILIILQRVLDRAADALAAA